MSQDARAAINRSALRSRRMTNTLFSIPPHMAQLALVPIFSFPFGDRLPLHVLWSIRTTMTKWIDMIDDISRTFSVLQPCAGTGPGPLKECSGSSATMRVRRRKAYYSGHAAGAALS